MKKFFKTFLVCLVIYIITVACFSDPLASSSSTTNIQTVYIGCSGSSFTPPSNNFAWTPPGILNAESHVSLYCKEFDKLVGIPYWGNSNMYIEGGVSAFNCADHDHQSQISQNNDGIWSLFFEHNTYWAGTAWLQFNSQCEVEYDDNGTYLGIQIGVYFKGQEFYGAGDYPLSHNEDILIEDAFLTDCSDPFPSEEYGCGEDDAN